MQDVDSESKSVLSTRSEGNIDYDLLNQFDENAITAV